MVNEWWKYTGSCIKQTFSKTSTTQENIRISRLKKRLLNFYKEENFKPEIKPIIKNLQDELNQLENKPAKGAKLGATSDRSWMVKVLKNIFERQNLQNQYLNYILMTINQNILAILRTFSNLKNNFMKNFIPMRQLPKLLLLKF